MRLFSLQSLRRYLAISLPLLASFLPVLSSHAQDALNNKLSEPVSAELGKLRALTDGKNYQEAVRRLNALISTVPADSYDLALLLQIRGQVLLADSQYDTAVGSFEGGLKLGDRYGYFDQNTVLGTLYTLSHLYYRQGAEIKNVARQKILFEKAYDYIDRWLRESSAPSEENQLFASSILYILATLDPAHTDLEKIRQSLIAAEKSIYLNLRVNNQAYILMVAALQQLGENCKVADTLELLVQSEPGNLYYWRQLIATYSALGAATQNAGDVRHYYLRELITYERAQSNGLLKTPSDNFNIVALCFHLGQFDRAAGLLNKGLKGGSIDGTRRNWEFLSLAFQRQHADDQAVAALVDATCIFPKDGQLEFSLAQLYHAQNKPAEAYAHLEMAVAKGNLDQLGSTYFFLGCVAYELKRFNDAAKWIECAVGKSDVKEEDLAHLTRAIKDAVTERDTFKKSPL